MARNVLVMPESFVDAEWRAEQLQELRLHLDECSFALEQLHPFDAAELSRVASVRAIARQLSALECAAAELESRLRQ